MAEGLVRRTDRWAEQNVTADKGILLGPDGLSSETGADARVRQRIIGQAQGMYQLSLLCL